MSSDQLHQYVYVSDASVALTSDELVDITVIARSRNAECGVTGMLLLMGGAFFQVLEGRSDDVLAIVEKIKCDPRHRNFRTLVNGPLENRQFGNWSMGTFEMDPDILSRDGLFLPTAENIEALFEGDASHKLRVFLETFLRIHSGEVAVVHSRMRRPLVLQDAVAF